VAFFAGPKESHQRNGLAVAGLLFRGSANQGSYVAIFKSCRFVVSPLPLEQHTCGNSSRERSNIADALLVLKPNSNFDQWREENRINRFSYQLSTEGLRKEIAAGVR